MLCKYGKKKLHYPNFHGGYRGDAIFFALLSPSYEKGLVVGLSIFIVGSDDVIHENLSHKDSNNPLGAPSGDHFGLIEMCILHCQPRIDHI